ncbi:hypothetical protein MTP03_21890 [Tsukamurella sp. PLM1]|nr:hypothetical protein MTP03_21890 [Tsukamurella sp. PLM1]
MTGSLFGDDGDLGAPPEAPSSRGPVEFVPTHAGTPLAVRMRPRDLDEVLGQEHLLGPGTRCGG